MPLNRYQRDELSPDEDHQHCKYYQPYAHDHRYWKDSVSKKDEDKKSTRGNPLKLSPI